MAEPRQWPALEVHARDVDKTGFLEGLVALALDDWHPLAIEDLVPIPLPPGSSWDPAPAAPPPPPAPLAWRICFKDAADRDGAAAALAAVGHHLTLRRLDLPDEDWVARSQASLRAVAAGPFIVAPPWDVPAALPDGSRLIVIEPSMGFGTGHHATTRLCLEALGALDDIGPAVLDVGSGSGVLSFAAALGGAVDVRGVDIDEDAVQAARRSAALNPSIPLVRFETGDVFTDRCAPVDLVLANLTGAMLIRSAAQLARLVKPDGRLIVSGFLHDEQATVEAALGGFAVDSTLGEDGWCALVLRRESA